MFVFYKILSKFLTIIQTKYYTIYKTRIPQILYPTKSLFYFFKTTHLKKYKFINYQFHSHLILHSYQKSFIKYPFIHYFL